MDGVRILVVHGAPVSERVIEAGADLELVCCARGGPVNVDVGALNARGLPLVNTPGKNADAVADLTLAFLIMLARNVPLGQRFLEAGNRLEDNFAGAEFIGYDLRGHTLGLVGLGQVGARVADRAAAFGMRVLAHDPFVEDFGRAEPTASLEALLAASDFVSLHLRATAETANLIDAEALARMRDGAFLVNTARESLVDEDALDAALASGRLRGAALDVFHDSGEPVRNRLLRHGNVVLLPHVGGATEETLARGAEMVAAAIADFLAERPLRNVINGAALAA
jgi:D-3-phosphoglycerate dehydrogenase